MLRYILPFAFVLASSLPAGAASDAPPGTYIRNGDLGTLTIQKDERDRLTFEIESVGSNCHSCAVSGAIQSGIGHADSWAADGSDSKCDIKFSVQGSTILVDPVTHEECRAFCGARAGFDGAYTIPPAACTSVGRQEARDRFVAQYRARRYSQAVRSLQSLVGQCERFMSWIEMDQVRNDLALAQYHKGEFSQCLETLNSTLAAKFRDEEELKSGKVHVYLPPCDFDNYVEVAKSTWFNRALCMKAKAGAR